ncbi:hypothetical protein LDENG_00057680 [Lucifuga dentata]|nr:hypothetical protein LDENG_00057680 [Lucifuga dentata]
MFNRCLEERASKMKWLLAAFAACVLVSCAHGASTSAIWCYDQPSCNDTRWPIIFPQFCNGSRQSPININSSAAQPDANLTDFTFFNFSSTTHMTKIENTGRTIKVILAEGVKISGGGLSEPYDSLQYHLHWGNGSSMPGSEHTVDGKQYPMELHIVNIKSSLNRNTTLGVADPTGLAALGFLIEASNTTDVPISWQNLSSYLNSITSGDQSVTIANMFSLDDLTVGVNRSNYYRYLGSLTTPSCNEAVVWTVFKDTIKVSQNLIDLFATTVHTGNSSTTPLMINTFRNVQPDLPVTTQPGSSSSNSSTMPTGSAIKASHSLGLLALGLVLGKAWS